MVNHLVGHTGNMFWLGMSKIESKTQKDIWDDGTRAEFNNYGENEPRLGCPLSQFTEIS